MSVHNCSKHPKKLLWTVSPWNGNKMSQMLGNLILLESFQRGKTLHFAGNVFGIIVNQHRSGQPRRARVAWETNQAARWGTPSPSPSFLMIFSPRAKNRHIIAGIVLGRIVILGTMTRFSVRLGFFILGLVKYCAPPSTVSRQMQISTQFMPPYHHRSQPRPYFSGIRFKATELIPRQGMCLSCKQISDEKWIKDVKWRESTHP